MAGWQGGDGSVRGAVSVLEKAHQSQLIRVPLAITLEGQGVGKFPRKRAAQELYTLSKFSALK